MIATSVLIKIFAREFYRLNAGFFLVVIGLAFGFLRDVEHLALGQFFISTFITMLIPGSIWTLYALKVILFNQLSFKKPENQFALAIDLFGWRIEVSSFLAVLGLQLAPVSLYGLFLIALGFKYGEHTSVTTAVVLIVILHVAGVFFLLRAARRQDTESHVWNVKKWFDKQWSKSYHQMALEWLARDQPFALAGIKVAGYAVLWAILYLYDGENYDLRLACIGVSIVFTSNYIPLYHLQRFETFEFPTYRNLPLSFLERFFHFMAITTILCLPEAALLITRFPDGFPQSSRWICLFFGFSILVLIYGMLFLKHLSLESLTKRSFFLLMAYFIVILFRIPLPMLLVVNVGVGILMWNRSYYAFEGNK